MKVSLLSNTYTVTRLEDKDIPAILQLCKENPKYYHYCPPAACIEGIKADKEALPEGKSLEDKYYVGFWTENKLVAVMDLILTYPDDATAFIGFFMTDVTIQGKGIGSKIIEEVLTYLKEQFSFVKLGYVKENKQSEHFWLKNGFQPTGIVTKTDYYEIVGMKRVL